MYKQDHLQLLLLTKTIFNLTLWYLIKMQTIFHAMINQSGSLRSSKLKTCINLVHLPGDNMISLNPTIKINKLKLDPRMKLYGHLNPSKIISILLLKKELYFIN